jgi:hypothetical protein
MASCSMGSNRRNGAEIIIVAHMYLPMPLVGVAHPSATSLPP